MRKKWLAVVITLTFIGIGIVPTTVAISKDKTTIPTLDSRGFIQGLIDNASNGDTIYIPSDIYYENIIINKSISLIGEDKNITIIDGSKIGHVVNVTADWVNISGFTIQNSGIDRDYAGIRLHANSTTITGNIICNNNYGITGGTFSGGYNHSRIANNIITNNGVCIRISHNSNDNTITGNTISYNSVGIINRYGNNNTITENIISFNGDDAIYSIGEHIVIRGNIITNNQYGITIRDHDVITSDSRDNIKEVPSPAKGDFTSIIGNTIHSSCWGIHIDSCSNNIIAENIITSHSSQGIWLYRSSNNIIKDNNISSNNDMGIDISYYCNNNTISGNTLSKNRCGIMFGYSSNYNNVSNNLIRWNKEDGIAIQYGNFSSIRDNTINGNKESGIDLELDSCYNNITRNILYSNRRGLSLVMFSNNNTITDNTLSNNTNGIFLIYCSNNTIMRNNLVDNKLNAFFVDFFNNSKNTWIRNYWNRPRVLPKVIFGIKMMDPYNLKKPLLRIEIDRRPALKPYDIG